MINEKYVLSNFLVKEILTFENKTLYPPKQQETHKRPWNQKKNTVSVVALRI